MIRDIKLMGSNSPKLLKKYNKPEYHRRHMIIMQRLEDMQRLKGHAKQLRQHAKQLEEYEKQHRSNELKKALTMKTVLDSKLDFGCKVPTILAINSMSMKSLHWVTVDTAKGDNSFVIEDETEAGDKILYNRWHRGYILVQRF
jgi:hypothetical protein